MKKQVIALLAATLVATGCGNEKGATTESTVDTTVESSAAEYTEESTAAETTVQKTPEVNPEYVGLTAEEICEKMTIEEKASQMVQGVIYELPTELMEAECYGSVLGHNSDWPALTSDTWKGIVNSYQDAALVTDSAIPFIYGQDSLHGVNFASDAVIFPHNINIGAANDPELTYAMGEMVGSDLIHTGMIWNFSPCVACAQDPRWGRTYESYSSDYTIVKELGVSYAEGLMSQGIVACPKHFLGDGRTAIGTGENSGGVERLIDRGDARISDAEIAEELEVYQALVDSGVQSIMISHSALNGIKMHENVDYIGYLKNDMGFEGVVLSDWDSIENCSGANLKENVILSVNAGVDMLMEVSNYDECKDYIIEAYNEGSISEERINDAVIRILNLKINAGLFDDPYSEKLVPKYEMGSEESATLALTLAEESMVPLKDDAGLTIPEGSRIFVTGPAASDTGAMCGGWTYIWQGESDKTVGEKWCANGTTIIEGLQAVSEEYGYEIITDPTKIDTCDIVLLCVGEMPYSEWMGDTEDLSITGALGLYGNKEAIELAAESGLPTFTLIVAGRNVIIDEYVDDWDSVVMCYLPGSEGGNAVAQLLSGAAPYTGTLPMPYYSSVDQIGTSECWKPVGYAVNK